MKSLEARIEQLETQLAFQDDVIEQLNQQVIRQDQALTQLQAQVQLVYSRLKTLAQNLPGGNNESPLDERPPHY